MNVEDFYRPVHIPELNSIQKEVLKLIPEKMLSYTNLTYIENNKEIFMGITKLRDFLISKKIYESVGSIAVNVTIEKDNGNFHKDSGPYKHSLNIPIIGCEDTYINFFTVNDEHAVVTVKDQGRTHRFFRYTEDQCKLIYEAETSGPYLLGVKTPHRVINKSDQTRIMLLIRLFPNVNLDDL